jgi:glycerol kinase
MSQKRVLSLDQGTTSSRAIVLGESSEILGKGQHEFTQHFPQLGWVEHDPKEIWQTQLTSLRDALDDAKCSAADIDAVGITNQRETVVLWDRDTGEPVAPAIVWQDRRTADFCDQHRDEWQAAIHEKTGLRLDPYFSGTKLKWLLDEIPGARERAEKGELAFGTIETWLVWKLTGGRVHVTDVSNASRTLLMNLRTLEWDDELLEWLGVPRVLLPEIVGNSEVVGTTDAQVVGAEIPIAGMAGDQQAALFGQLCVEKGMVKNTYGTGCFLLMQTGDEPVLSEQRLLTTVAWKLGDAPCQYALEGSVFTAGSVVQWLRDGLGIIKESADVNALAEQVEDNGGVYLAPAFTGLGAPHWDPYARGVMAGLTRGSTAAHIARAALESIAYQVDDLVTAMRADTGLDLAEVRVDGGASRSDLLMQFQSDLLDCTITRSAIAETTALGAAFLAGLATGVWSDVDELQSLWQQERRFTPAGDAEQINTQRRGWNAAVKRSLGWAREVERSDDA